MLRLYVSCPRYMLSFPPLPGGLSTSRGDRENQQNSAAKKRRKVCLRVHFKSLRHTCGETYCFRHLFMILGKGCLGKEKDFSPLFMHYLIFRLSHFLPLRKPYQICLVRARACVWSEALTKIMLSTPYSSMSNMFSTRPFRSSCES